MSNPQCGTRGVFFNQATKDWEKHRCERLRGHQGKHMYHPPHHRAIYFDDSTSNVITWPRTPALAAITQSCIVCGHNASDCICQPPASDTPNIVTRIEVIDHRTNGAPTGRAFVAWDAAVTLSYQDNGRTLKVFVDDLRRATPPASEDHE